MTVASAGGDDDVADIVVVDRELLILLMLFVFVPFGGTTGYCARNRSRGSVRHLKIIHSQLYYCSCSC
jgi:hypothetical protein